MALLISPLALAANRAQTRRPVRGICNVRCRDRAPCRSCPWLAVASSYGLSEPPGRAPDLTLPTSSPTQVPFSLRLYPKAEAAVDVSARSDDGVRAILVSSSERCWTLPSLPTNRSRRSGVSTERTIRRSWQPNREPCLDILEWLDAFACSRDLYGATSDIVIRKVTTCKQRRSNHSKISRHGSLLGCQDGGSSGRSTRPTGASVGWERGAKVQQRSLLEHQE